MKLGTIDRKTALTTLQEMLRIAEASAYASTTDPNADPDWRRGADALRLAVDHLGDLGDEELEKAYLNLSAALTTKNTADLNEETVQAACNALFAYQRDRYESANVKPTRCAVCAGYHWPAMGSDIDRQGCDCAARSFSKYGRNFVCSHYGSEMDTMLFEFVRPIPDEWKDKDPVCDNCIRKAVREGLLAEIYGDYPWGLVRFPKGAVLSKETAEEFEPPKALPSELAIAEARRYYSDYLRGLEKNVAEYRATATSTELWVTPEDDARARRNADGHADHLHGHAVLTQTALDALDYYERAINFHHWCGEDEGLQRIGEAHAVFKAIADSEKPGLVERWDAHLAMEALEQLGAQTKKRDAQ